MEEPHIERLRRLIEEQYPGGCFGTILCHELHHGREPGGLHFTALAAKWGISVSALGELIYDHCKRLEPDPVVRHELEKSCPADQNSG